MIEDREKDLKSRIEKYEMGGSSYSADEKPERGKGPYGRKFGASSRYHKGKDAFGSREYDYSYEEGPREEASNRKVDRKSPAGRTTREHSRSDRRKQGDDRDSK